MAAYLTEKAHSVSVVEVEETPFRRFLGERVGHTLMKVSPGGPTAPAPPTLYLPFSSHPCAPRPTPTGRCLRTTASSSTCRLRCRSCGPRRARWALLHCPHPGPSAPLLCPGAAHPPRHSPQLKEVVLKSSKVVRADVCVVGIGE